MKWRRLPASQCAASATTRRSFRRSPRAFWCPWRRTRWPDGLPVQRQEPPRSIVRRCERLALQRSSRSPNAGWRIARCRHRRGSSCSTSRSSVGCDRARSSRCWSSSTCRLEAGHYDSMRILYSAIDQSVPAAHGGSVHVTAVAEGLAELGHDVHVLVSPGDRGEVPTGKAQWFALPPPLGNRRLRLLRARGGCISRAAVSARRRHRALLQFRRRRDSRREESRRARRARSECAGRRSSGLAEAARRPRAHRRADAPLARLAVPAGRCDRDAQRAKSFRRTCLRRRFCGPNGAPTPSAFVPARPGACRSRAATATSLRCFPAPFAPGTARSTWSTPSGGFARAAGTTSRPCSSATVRSCPRVRDAAAGLDGITLVGAVPHDRRSGDPCRRRHRRRAVRRRRSSVAGARVSLVAAEDLRIHGLRPPGRRAAHRASRGHRERRAGRAALRRRRIPTRWPMRSRVLPMPVRAAAARRGRSRARRQRIQLGEPLPAARSAPFRMPADVSHAHPDRD